MTRAQRAQALFEEGYNCAQSVVLAFEDVLSPDHLTLAKLSSALGGGVARLREVCGAVSAMAIVLGLCYDLGQIPAQEEKAAHYARVRSLAEAFQKEAGALRCQDLLAQVPTTQGPAPEARTPAYYLRRPCGSYCAIAAGLLEAYLASHPFETPPEKA